MKFLVVGAGALGGCVAALLHRSGHGVRVTARGDHLRALSRDGLCLRRPQGELRVKFPVAERFVPLVEEVVLLCVKSQDTARAIAGLPPETPIVCMQNGVENEIYVHAAGHPTYGALTWIFAAHLEPGVVALHAAGCPGLFALGAWPAGVGRAAQVAQALREAGFDAQARADVMRWKRGKLVSNLPGALQAAGAPHGPAEIEAIVAEGEAVLRAAGLDWIPPTELRASSAHIVHAEIDGAPRPGGSLWQSRQRGRPSEVHYLNGYIVRLGRAHDVPTPLNEDALRALQEAQ